MWSPNSAAVAGGGRSLAGAFAAPGWKNVGFISICGHNLIAHFHILPRRRGWLYVEKSIVDLSHSCRSYVKGTVYREPYDYRILAGDSICPSFSSSQCLPFTIMGVRM